MQLDTAARRERRRYRRRPSIRNVTRLTWETLSGRVVTRATLLDVSEGGVLLSAETPPPMRTTPKSMPHHSRVVKILRISARTAPPITRLLPWS